MSANLFLLSAAPCYLCCSFSFVSVTDSLIIQNYFHPPSVILIFNFHIYYKGFIFLLSASYLFFFLILWTHIQFWLPSLLLIVCSPCNTFVCRFSTAAQFQQPAMSYFDHCVCTRCCVGTALCLRECCISISICYSQYFPQWSELFIVCMQIR